MKSGEGVITTARQSISEGTIRLLREPPTRGFTELWNRIAIETMERKIGEVFNSGGKTFIAIENNSAYCYGCCFENGSCRSYNVGKCDIKDRSDGHGVIFKRLDDIKSTNENETKSDLEVKRMDFSRVLQYLKDGAVARRESWSGNKSIFLAKEVNGMLPFFCINTKDGRKGVYTATACDLLAEDWMVIKI